MPREMARPGLNGGLPHRNVTKVHLVLPYSFLILPLSLREHDLSQSPTAMPGGLSSASRGHPRVILQVLSQMVTQECRFSQAGQHDTFVAISLFFCCIFRV